jgi:nicotinamidase/pyrazinamidase
MMTDSERTQAPFVGLVIDVQRDFMTPAAEGGRLYVRDLADETDWGAAGIVPQLVATVEWMREQCAAIIYTGDWHSHDDREIDSVSPDPARETYPPHCMGASDDPEERRGAELIPEVAPTGEMVVLERDATDDDARAAAERAVRSGAAIFVQKREFSLFVGNPASEALVRAIAEAVGGRPEFVVCGVAADVCVRHAVDGLLERGHAVTVVRDATWGLGLLGTAETFDQWATRGARVVDTAELDSLRPATV